MPTRSCCLAATLALLTAGAAAAETKEITMPHHATGPFDVRLATLAAYNDSDPSMARRSIDKRFHGDLQATSRGEMLSVGTARDNGGYVAIERVSGTLAGRTGSFALQHSATMTRGVPALEIRVVPGSGSGELAGIAGSMTIDIAAAGRHAYRFDYTFDGP